MFDFAGTLCSDKYFKTPPPGITDWDRIVNRIFDDECTLNKWLKGEIGLNRIVQLICGHVNADESVVENVMRQGCTDLKLNQEVLDFAIEQKRNGTKIAIVTINMDVFTNIVAPSHGLDSLFHTIVNSADYKTIDKVFLWQRALVELGDFAFSDCLLIDDKLCHVERFRELGGKAVQYVNEMQFREWQNKELR